MNLGVISQMVFSPMTHKVEEPGLLHPLQQGATSTFFSGYLVATPATNTGVFKRAPKWRSRRPSWRRDGWESLPDGAMVPGVVSQLPEVRKCMGKSGSELVRDKDHHPRCLGAWVCDPSAHVR